MPLTLLFLVSGYLIGSVPYSWLVGRRTGTPDLRRVGSGNVGATNLFRVSGPGAAALAFALDAVKGAVPVVLARALGASTGVTAAVGLTTVVGHVYPCWLRFRGGKGVSTACGAFGVLAPAATLVAAGAFAIVVAATRYVSAGSVLAGLTLAPAAAALGSPRETVTAGIVAGVLIIVRHRANLARLAAGTERRLGRKDRTLESSLK